MKTKNLFQSVILLLSFMMMNEFAIAQLTCHGNKVLMSYCTCNRASQQKCVPQSQVQQYLDNRWIIGTCPTCPFRVAGSDNSQLTVQPNPISQSATISFSLAESEKLSMKIFDVNGRLVTLLADKIFETGDYNFVWNSADVNAGIYFLQFKSEEKLITEKLIVTK